MNACHSALLKFLSLLPILSMTSAVNADQTPYRHGQLTIENVSATPGKAEGRSILRFRIINESKTRTRLLGVEALIAAEARIMGKMKNRKPVIYNSIRVREESDLDFSTHHLWIELGPLLSAVKAGEKFPIEFIFIDNRIRIDVHVHLNKG